MKRNWITVVGIVAVLTFGLVGTGIAQERAYKLIVHPTNGLSSITKRDAAALFLKKTKTWKNGRTVMPVDLQADSPTRQAFSEDVLDKSLSAVSSYWQTRIYSGRDVPPPTKASDRDVIAYVAANADAIGYVSAGAPTTAVKVLNVD